MVDVQFTPYILPVLATAALILALALWVWLRRPGPNVAIFVVFALAIAEWCATYGIALGVYEVGARTFWSKIQYIGIALAPVFWLIVVLRNTGRGHRLGPGRSLLLFLVPALGTLLVFTNEAHRLYWQEVAVDPSGGFSYFSVRYGPGFWLYIGYNYAVLVAGMVLLIRTIVRSTGPYRAQAAGLLVAAALPLLGNLAYVLRWVEPPSLDLTVFAFAVSVAVTAWSLYRYRLLDLVPVARDLIFEQISDGFLVVDRWGRIIDLNPSAARYLGLPAARAIGRAAASLLPPESLTVDGPAAGAAGRLVELSGEIGSRCLELRTFAVSDGNQADAGRLVLLRDVTEQRRSEAALQAAEQRATRLQTAAEIGATVSHELNQPLAVITGYLELLRDRSPLTDQQARMFREMEAAAAEMERRIREIERLRDYVTKSYGEGLTVIDLEKSESTPDLAARAEPRPRP
jgi:signal transduction histidine kinase